MTSPFRKAAVILAAAVSLAPAFPSALSQTSRIAADAISPSASRVALKNTVPTRARLATDLGAAPADRALTSVTVRFNMSAAQSAALDALIVAQQNPQSPQYHQWLTPEQYAARFGLSSPDIAKVTAWLQSQGLTVTGVARGHGFVTVSGTVEKLNTAFGTSIHTISLDGEQHVANLTEPTLPAAIAAVTSTVTGLSDLRLKPRVHSRFTSSISGSHFVAPGDFYTIYDMNSLITAGITGSGVTIAIAGQTDILLSDVAAFRAASGLAANVPVIKLIGTDPGTPLSNGVAEDQVEASLDVEWSGAVAPAATILYVNSKDVIGTSLTQIIDQNLAPIASVSYGNCESGFGASNVIAFNQILRQGASQGQTVVGPAGDSGATDCDYQTTLATQGLAVDFPASSPYVTSLGGTQFSDTAGTYWSAANNTSYNGSSSALSYIPEAVWNESSPTNGLSSGGGGASSVFTKPAWQIGTGVPADFSRDVPDISFTAAAGHDGYLYCQGGFCTSGYRNGVNGNLDVVGGTSVSTPAFAGVLALLEQKLSGRVGPANPAIYALANSSYYSSVFHDVTTGSNVSACAIGSLNCTAVATTCNGSANNGQGCIGYSATPGYDLASGWGSLDIFNFVSNYARVTPLSYGTNGVNPSSTALSSANASVAQGTTISLTAMVSAATTGSSPTPTGTVQLLVDGVASGGSVALTSGSAALSYSTTSLVCGVHVLGAAYSGDTNYAGSKGTFNLTITSTTCADFTLSPATGNLTIKSGATGSATFTVAPTNGFTGTVTMTASGSINASYVFTPASVIITGTTPGTTVFALTASVSNAQTTTGLHQIGPGIASAHSSSNPWQKLTLPATGITIAGLFLLVLPRRRTRWTALIVTLVAVGMLGASGCGTSSTSAPGPVITNTPAGSYSITITASGVSPAGAALSHSSTFSVVVQ